MSIIERNLDNGSTWRAQKHALTAEILVSEGSLGTWAPDAAATPAFDLRVSLLDPDAAIPEHIIRSGHVIVIEVRRDHPASVARFTTLVREAAPAQVIAAVPDVTLDDARALLRAGASDILALPFFENELEATLGRILSDLENKDADPGPAGRIVSVIKSGGGVGATALLTQLACLQAVRESAGGGGTCLIDLDLQFGNAALYLGTLPSLGVKDLIEAGARADGALLRSTATKHESGLHFIAAPPELLPLDALDQDQVGSILNLATREFETLFVDLPSSWTNWSLSVLAKSNLILLVCELTVASLHQARRQLDLIDQQGLGEIPLSIVMNRVEKKLFKSINLKDAVRTLGRPVSYTIADDPDTVVTALDQGVLFSAVSARSRASRDVRMVSDGVGGVLAGAA